MIKLNPELSKRYAVAKSVRMGRFNHVYLGVIDLAKITEKQAEKLLKTGHLTLKPVKKTAPKVEKVETEAEADN